MATRIDMPQLGQTMEEGTILRWLKKEGDQVRKGEPVVLLQTEKVEYELEAPAPGQLAKILVSEGTTLRVGGAMGIIAQEGEDISALLASWAAPTPAAAKAPAPATAPTAVQAPAAPAAAPVQAAVAAPSREKVKITPRAKRLAEEHGIKIETLVGTGPEGRIVEEDVQRAIEAMKAGVPAAEAVPDLIPLTGMRKAIFDRLGGSWRNAARVTLFAEADVTRLVELRKERGSRWEAESGLKISYNDLILKGVVVALTEKPRINCTLTPEGIRVHKEVHLGFAVDLGEGLVAPAIRDAHKKSLLEIAREARAIAEKARSGRLVPHDLEGGTFTVTNLGGFGVELFTPIINPPQAAILGVGKIVEKPVVLNGGIHIRAMLGLSLVFDHRLIDGAPAAQFLAKLKELLEQPEGWIG
ncbi:MAG: 2-oxo acid dehydrogenase subunit E2 [candidate division NC10 bacterium]|nr:2-oxo acid dehydrogenase subunit E2 [candidate division NC10 bacterium]